jgi:type IV pilus assembly protein PilB
MDDRKLAEGLVNETIISDELAQKLINEAGQTGVSLENILYGRRLVDEESVARVKSRIENIPFERVTPQMITDEALKFIPEETARNYRLVPIKKEGDMLVVGMLNPDDSRAAEALRFVSQQNRLKLGIYLVTPSDLEMALRRYSPYQTEIQSAIRSLDIKPGAGLTAAQKAVSLEAGAAVAEEAPIIKIVSSTLREAVEENASDIHIEPERTRLRIRFRIDGTLKEAAVFPLELHQPIISRIKILSELKIDETRVPQDGRFRTTIFNRDIDFRVSTFPTPNGEKIAIRVLDPTIGLKKIGELGLVGSSAAIVEEAIKKPFGMVLISGPTGSGKTTTLYALLQMLNSVGVNVLSMEDPVEYFIDGVNQSQIRPEIGYTFASGLRQAVRQDPDIIMVGEIRDRETADLAVQAALTGHIVLSTLHTNNAVGVIPRLLDMGVEPFLLPSSLNVMIAQRLARKLCPECRKPEPAPPEIEKIIRKELGGMTKENSEALRQRGINPEGPFQIYRAAGCSACKGKGTSGRIGLFEVFKMTRELEEIIGAGPTEGKLKDESKRQGMVSLRQDAVVKLLEGVIPVEELLRETAET